MSQLELLPDAKLTALACDACGLHTIASDECDADGEPTWLLEAPDCGPYVAREGHVACAACGAILEIRQVVPLDAPTPRDWVLRTKDITARVWDEANYDNRWRERVKTLKPLPEGWDDAIITDVAMAWLERTRLVGFGHGSDLAKASAEAGMAGRMLETMERRRWIRRFPKPTPSREQQFFGINGLGPEHYGYEPGAVAPHV